MRKFNVDIVRLSSYTSTHHPNVEAANYLAAAKKVFTADVSPLDMRGIIVKSCEDKENKNSRIFQMPNFVPLLKTKNSTGHRNWPPIILDKLEHAGCEWSLTKFRGAFEKERHAIKNNENVLSIIYPGDRRGFASVLNEFHVSTSTKKILNRQGDLARFAIGISSEYRVKHEAYREIRNEIQYIHENLSGLWGIEITDIPNQSPLSLDSKETWFVFENYLDFFQFKMYF